MAPPLTRIALRVLLIVPAAVVLLALGLMAALYAGGATWAVNRWLRGVNPYPDATLESGWVSGNLINDIQLHDVRLTGAHGESRFRLDTLRLRYDLGSLLGDEIVVREVRLAGPRIILQRLPDSSWDLLAPLTRATAPSASPVRRINLQRISITNGGALVRFSRTGADSALRVESIQGEVGGLLLGEEVRVGSATLSLRFLPPGESDGWGVLEAQGSMEKDRLTLDRKSVV